MIACGQDLLTLLLKNARVRCQHHLDGSDFGRREQTTLHAQVRGEERASGPACCLAVAEY